jgi:hypothetical protein
MIHSIQKSFPIRIQGTHQAKCPDTVSDIYLLGLKTNNQYLTAFGLRLLSVAARADGDISNALMYLDEAANIYMRFDKSRYLDCMKDLMDISGESKKPNLLVRNPRMHMNLKEN